MVGPLATDTRLSVDATSPLLIHGEVSPGLGAPTTQTVSPARTECDANCAGSATGPEPVAPLGAVTLAAGLSPATLSRTRSVVESRPTTRAGRTTPSTVVTSTFVASPMSRSLVRISSALRMQTPDPRRVPCLSRALTATTESATATATALAVAIGVLAGTTPGSETWSDGRPSAPTAPSTASVRIAPAAPATSVVVQRGFGRTVVVRRRAARARSGAATAGRVGAGVGRDRTRGRRRRVDCRVPRIRARRPRSPSRSSVTTHIPFAAAPGDRRNRGAWANPGGRSVDSATCSGPRTTCATG